MRPRPATPKTTGALSEIPAPATVKPSSASGAPGETATIVQPAGGSNEPPTRRCCASPRRVPCPKKRPAAIAAPNTSCPSPLTAGSAFNAVSRKSALQLSVPPSTTKAAPATSPSTRSPRSSRTRRRGRETTGGGSSSDRSSSAASPISAATATRIASRPTPAPRAARPRRRRRAPRWSRGRGPAASPACRCASRSGGVRVDADVEDAGGGSRQDERGRERGHRGWSRAPASRPRRPRTTARPRREPKRSTAGPARKSIAGSDPTAMKKSATPSVPFVAPVAVWTLGRSRPRRPRTDRGRRIPPAFREGARDRHASSPPPSSAQLPGRRRTFALSSPSVAPRFRHLSSGARDADRLVALLRRAEAASEVVAAAQRGRLDRGHCRRSSGSWRPPTCTGERPRSARAQERSRRTPSSTSPPEASRARRRAPFSPTGCCRDGTPTSPARRSGSSRTAGTPLSSASTTRSCRTSAAEPSCCGWSSDVVLPRVAVLDALLLGAGLGALYGLGLVAQRTRRASTRWARARGRLGCARDRRGDPARSRRAALALCRRRVGRGNRVCGRPARTPGTGAPPAGRRRAGGWRRGSPSWVRRSSSCSSPRSSAGLWPKAARSSGTRGRSGCRRPGRSSTSAASTPGSADSRASPMRLSAVPAGARGERVRDHGQHERVAAGAAALGRRRRVRRRRSPRCSRCASGPAILWPCLALLALLPTFTALLGSSLGDEPLMLLVGLGGACSALWLLERDARFAALAGLFLAAAALAKSEGLPIAVVVAATTLVVAVAAAAAAAARAGARPAGALRGNPAVEDLDPKQRTCPRARTTGSRTRFIPGCSPIASIASRTRPASCPATCSGRATGCSRCPLMLAAALLAAPRRPALSASRRVRRRACRRPARRLLDRLPAVDWYVQTSAERGVASGVVLAAVFLPLLLAEASRRRRASR